MVRARTLLPVIALGLLLAGCGGGGSGGSAVVSQLRGVSVTSANVNTATAVVVNSPSVADGSSGGAAFLTGVIVQPVQSDFHFVDFALQQLTGSAVQNSFGSSVAGVIGSGPQDCTDGGRVFVSPTVSDPSYLTAGDRVGLQFVNCQENGVTLDGAFTITIDSVSSGFAYATPAVAPYDLTFTVELGNFSVVDLTSNLLANGDLTIATSEDSAGLKSLELSGSALGAESGTESAVLTDYDFLMTSDSSGAFTLHVPGATIGSSKLGGSVSFHTTTDFAGNDNQYNGNPTAGELQITSNIDASNAIVTAQSDGTNVKIDLDEKGNGSYITSMTTWSDLAAL